MTEKLLRNLDVPYDDPITSNGYSVSNGSSSVSNGSHTVPNGGGPVANGHGVPDEDDPVALLMEVPFKEYDSQRLYVYFCNWYRRIFNRDYDVMRAKDLNIINGFISWYGAETAGLIVQRLFTRHSGRWQGHPVSTGTLARGSRWITDHVEQEVRTAPKIRFKSLSVLS